MNVNTLIAWFQYVPVLKQVVNSVFKPKPKTTASIMAGFNEKLTELEEHVTNSLEEKKEHELDIAALQLKADNAGKEAEAARATATNLRALLGL